MADEFRQRGGIGAFGAAVIGAIVGASAAFMANKDNREKVKEKLDDVSRKGEQKLSEMKIKAADVKEKGRSRLVEELDKAKKKLERDQKEDL